MQSKSDTYDKFLEFRAAIIRAIALEWQNPEFKKALLADPKAAMKEWLKYDFPFDMDVKADDNSAKWTPGLNGGWTVYTMNVVDVMLPPRPEPVPGEKQVLVEANALAEYNQTHLTFMKPKA